MINNDVRNDTLTGLLSELTESIMRKSEHQLPCVVTKVSANRQRVSVRPLIRIVTQEGETLRRDIIDGVPVYQAGAGDLLLSFPVAVGNIGWIAASDRDISLFKQSYAESDPGSRRMHSFSDSVFVPDVMTNFTIAGEDATAMVIQNRNGSVKIAVDQNQIRIVNGASRIEVNDGTVVINGATITAAGDVVTAAGVSLNNHNHTQANDSAGNTQQDTSAAVATE